MTIMEVMKARHSVRDYLDTPIEESKRELIEKKVEAVNAESGMHFQVIFDEPGAFNVTTPGSGIFPNCTNYFALVAKPDKEEEVGYYGEQLVLYVQELGLNTCWSAKSHKEKNVVAKVGANEELYMLIALGYGADDGEPHKSKSKLVLSDYNDESPDWYKFGMRAVKLAPTAKNQQKFYITRDGNTVKAKAKRGPYTKVDLGIVKLHFELGAGKFTFNWAEDDKKKKKDE